MSTPARSSLVPVCNRIGFMGLEERIVSTLKDVLRHFRLNARLRVAGGRVRDKVVLGEELLPQQAGWHHRISIFGNSRAKVTEKTLPSATSFRQAREFHTTSIKRARDYYEVLGLSKGATISEIKKAYYALAKVHHPDMNEGDTQAEKRFQEIQKAYEVLKDEEQRSLYDQVGADAYERGVGAGEGGPFDESFGFSFSDFGGMWNTFVKDPFDMEASEDVVLQVQLSFMESVKGCTKRLQFTTTLRCSSCKGTGAQHGMKPQVCKACRGRGVTHFSKGFFSMETTCTTCGGEGHVVKEKCRSCSGTGVVHGRKELDVEIPAGVKNGGTMKLPGEGGAGPRGHAPGVLVVKFEVLPDPVFRRVGSDIHVDSEISFTQAILGGTIQVPTLTGHAVLKVRAGTQPGQKLCLKGKGIKVPHKPPGDQVVNICVLMPVNLTRRQRLIIEELEKEERETENLAAAGSG